MLFACISLNFATFLLCDSCARLSLQLGMIFRFFSWQLSLLLGMLFSLSLALFLTFFAFDCSLYVLHIDDQAYLRELSLNSSLTSCLRSSARDIDAASAVTAHDVHFRDQELSCA